jgi:hypothetical protein
MHGAFTFLTFSLIEALSIIVFIMLMFRFNVKTYWKDIIMTGTLLTLASYLSRFVFDIPQFAPVIFLVLLILFLTIIFKVIWYYASMMGIFGYSVSAAIQYALIFSPHNLLTLEEMIANPLLGGIVQLTTAIITIVIGYIVYKRRSHFNFVPTYDGNLFRVKGERKFALRVSIIAMVLLVVAFMFRYIDPIIHLVSLVVIVGVILHILYSKESDE